MFEKQIDISTLTNNADEINSSIEKRMFSFAISRARNLHQSQQQNTARLHIEQLLKENLRLQKELEGKNRQIEDLRLLVKQKDLQIFYHQKVQKELKNSLENMRLYNEQFIGEIDLKNKELESLKNKKQASQINCNQIYKLRSKYQILKQKYYNVKAQSRQLSRNMTPQKRPLSPKRGTLMNHIKDYVSTTKAKIRAESRNKDYFTK